MVPEEGGTKMLDRVNLCRVHDRLFIGTCHAQVKGSDRFSTDRVLSGNIDTWLELYVIDGKTCYFFHRVDPFF